MAAEAVLGSAAAPLLPGAGRGGSAARPAEGIYPAVLLLSPEVFQEGRSRPGLPVVFSYNIV